MKRIVNVGVKVNADEVRELNTMICDCGNTIVRAEKESSMHLYKTYKAKCCKGNYNFVGLKKFKGDDIMENTKKEKVAKVTKITKETKKNAVDIVIEITNRNKTITEIIKPGKKGFTGAQMYNGIIRNLNNKVVLEKLKTTYPELWNHQFNKDVGSKQKAIVYKTLGIEQTSTEKVYA